MTYKEYYETYKRTHRKYPNLANLPIDDMDREIGDTITRRYHKQGSRWVLDKEDRERTTTRRLINSVDAVPFFRSLGGYERTETAYSRYGDLPYKITSISPDRQTRIVREFYLF